MPRVKLGRDAATEHLAVVNNLIRKAMLDQGYDRNREPLAKKMNMSMSWFNAKLRRNKWTMEELVMLASILRLTAEDAAVILGVKSA